MHKYTYKFEGPLVLEILAPIKQDADERLQRFIDNLNRIAFETGFVVQKGSLIDCGETDA